jgi:hypothetical protein
MNHVLFLILLVASLSSDLLAPSSAQLDDILSTYPPSWLLSDVAIIDDDDDNDGNCHSDDEDDAVIVGNPRRRTIRGAIESASTATTTRDQWSSSRMWKGKGGYDGELLGGEGGKGADDA